jgi:predicted Zn-dependent peptidase
LYPELHPYRYPLDGVETIVATLDRSEAIECHRRFLGPDQAGIVVAGDVDPEAVARVLEERLAGWRGPKIKLPEIPTPDPATHPRILLLDRPGAAQAVVRVGHVGIARSDADFEPLLLVNQIVGGQFTSRLNEKLREERGYTYGVRSHYDCRLARGPFSIVTSLQSDKLADALGDLYHELLALVGGRPPSQTELDDARRALVEGQSRNFETPAALVNRYANLFIHGFPADYYTLFPERLAAINLDVLNAAMHRQFHPGAIVAVVVADAASVADSLRRLDWAELELIKD